MTIDVFISYSRNDKDFAGRLAAQLEDDFNVWWDRDLVGGQDYTQALMDAIDRGSTTLIILSYASIQSEWVAKETERALLNSRVIPVRIDNSEIPANLAEKHCLQIDPTAELNSQDALLQLKRDIRLALGEIRTDNVLVEREMKNATRRETVRKFALALAASTALAAVAAITPLWYDWMIARTQERLESSFTDLNLKLKPAAEAGLSEGILIGKKFRLVKVDDELTNALTSAEKCELPISEQCTFDDGARYCPNSYTASTKYRHWRDHLQLGTADMFDFFNWRCIDSGDSLFHLVTPPSGWSETYHALSVDPDIFETSWAKLIEDGKYIEARKLLEDAFRAGQTRAALPLAVMYDQGIGGPKDLLRSRELLKHAAISANPAIRSAARFHLGISLLFGRGGPPEGELGSLLVRQSLQEGFLPLKSHSLVSMSSKRIVVSTFSEAFKEINLLAKQGDVIAMTLKGLFASFQIGVPPCERNVCEEIANEMISALNELKQPRLAQAIQSSLKAARQQSADRLFAAQIAEGRVVFIESRSEQALLQRSARNSVQRTAPVGMSITPAKASAMPLRIFVRR